MSYEKSNVLDSYLIEKEWDSENIQDIIDLVLDNVQHIAYNQDVNTI